MLGCQVYGIVSCTCSILILFIWHCQVSAPILKGLVKKRFGKEIKLKDLHNIRQVKNKQNKLSDADQIVSIVEDLKARGDPADKGGSIQIIYIQT